MEKRQEKPVETPLAPGYCCKEPLTLEEAAAFTGLSRAFLYQLTHEKRIPCYKPLGKKLYFKRTELEVFLFRNKQAADYEAAAAAEAVLNKEKR